MSPRQRLSVALLTSARAWRGSGVSFAQIATALLDRGHRAHMLVGEGSVLQEFIVRGFSASQVPTAHTTIEGALAIVRELRAVQADCLVVDRPRDLRLGALASLLRPVRLINRYNLSRPSPPRDLVSRLAYRRVDLTIFVSHTVARRAFAGAKYMTGRPTRVIHEGVGPEFYPDSSAAATFRARWRLDSRGFILAVGSLTADKRYPFLFEAIRRLGPGSPLLVICGDGPLMHQLQAESARRGVETQFLGMLAPEALRGAYCAARCLVHACDIETFGLSVLEAMGCACPVVAVDAGAIPEVLGNAGILTPPDDPDRFAERLQEVLRSPDRVRLMAQAGEQRAGENFSLARMQQQHIEAIEEACFATHPEIRIEHAQPAPPGL